MGAPAARPFQGRGADPAGPRQRPGIARPVPHVACHVYGSHGLLASCFFPVCINDGKFSVKCKKSKHRREVNVHTHRRIPVFPVTTRACNTVRVMSVTQCGDIARTITRTAHRRCLHMENCDAQMSQVWGGSPWEAGGDDAGRCGTLTPVKCSVAGRTAACLTSKRSWARRGVRSPEPSLPRGS